MIEMNTGLNRIQLVVEINFTVKMLAKGDL